MKDYLKKVGDSDPERTELVRSRIAELEGLAAEVRKAGKTSAAAKPTKPTKPD
jgi:hypothetical protein